MAEPVTFQEQQEGATSTVTVLETEEQLLKSKQTSIHFIKSIETSCTHDNSPLSGIRILDLTRIVAGPYCTMILSDLGAEVIKIERPGTGDEARKWGPPFIGNTPESCYFVAVNRNKKSVCVDLKTSKGRNLIYSLAEKSDVFVENYVPGKLDKIGLGYEDLRKIAPSMIYCSITGYGHLGPYRNKPGYDVIAASVGGLLHITGPRNGEPVKVGVASTDLATGLYAHGAIMAALIKRSRTGQGQKIDCNLLSTQIASLINIGSNYLNAGKEASRWGTAHESIVPYEAFPTKDGYFTIGTGSDLHFKEFCGKIGHPELADDKKYLTNTSRVQHREELISFLRSVLMTKTNKEWARVLENVSFPCGPINSLKEAFGDPHVEAVGLVEKISHPVAGDIKVVGPPVVYSDGGNCVRSAPPTLGQHTAEVLSDVLGLSDVEIGVLKEEKEVPTVTLKLRKPRNDRKVQWSTGTVDNENMNKKKSKCCCIFNKPRSFGESSSEDSDDECDHCHGHVERKKNEPPNTSDCVDGGGSSTIKSEPSQTSTLDN